MGKRTHRLYRKKEKKYKFILKDRIEEYRENERKKN